MKTLQNQYIEITEGKGNKDHFLKQARHLFPELLTVNSIFNDTVKILKGKNILTEAVGGIITQNPNKPDWFKIFNTNIKEAVGVKDKKEYGDQNTFEKIDKDVAKDLESNFDNSDPKNIDNVYGQSFLMGYLAEMDDPKNADKTVDELKKIVAKNMAQDINYYAKNGMFGVKGIGLETSKEPKAPTGKYKSSGYGNLKENLDPKFKKGDKVTYLDHPGEIIGVRTDTSGRTHYTISYISKNNKRRIVQGVYNKRGEIKPLKENLEQPKKYYAVYNIQGEYGEPLTLTANTKEEMLDRLNTTYLELTGETRAPYGIEDFEDAFYNGKKLDHFISDDWASVTDNKEVFKKDIEIFSRKEKMNESKLRSIISSIIREELKNESYDYETQADLRGMANEESLAQAIKLAKAISREGVVQHVNQREDGSYEVSDWYDSDTTAFSYQNGVEI